MRAPALPVGLAATVFALGNALAAHDWLVAVSAGLLVCVGIVLLVPPPTSGARDPRQAELPVAAVEVRGDIRRVRR